MIREELVLALCAVIGTTAGAVALADGPATKATPAVDFQRVVRPILSDNCFACHGPDPNTRLADLRLDTREGAFAKRENGVPIVPGDPGASLVYQRITTSDEALRMPPASSHKTLSEQQKETLKRWIEQGAPWKEHWSFVAPARSPLPEVKNKGWVRNPVDTFILSKLESAGLEPAPEADRRTLIRRLSLDLRGLPPTPAEVEAYVNDRSPSAYENLVDRLLQSPQWGEHRARYWLDAARYADTHGIHIDNYREMWPYRDWVISAFNRNLPFDRFTLEQLGGDLLPGRTMDQQIASGFQRCNATTNEGGAIAEEFEAIYAKDRVDTTGTVWLGLTVGCATCHDHKFDPISMKDFYSLAAFFRNTTQDPMDGNIPDTPPIVVVPKVEDLDRWRQLSRDDQAVRDNLRRLSSRESKAFEKWLNSKKRQEVAAPADLAAQLFHLTVENDARLALQGTAQPLALKPGVTMGEGHQAGTKALHFGPGAQLEVPEIGYFDASAPFTLSAWILAPKNDDNFTVLSKSDPADKDRGWGLDINARVPQLRLTGDEGKSIVVRAGHLEQLKPGAWAHLLFTYDGSREHMGMGFFINGRAVATQGNEVLQDLAGDIRNTAPLRIGSDGAKRFFDGGAMADVRIFKRVLTADEAYFTFAWSQVAAARSKPARQLAEAERRGFHLHFLNRENKEYRNLVSRGLELARAKRQIRNRGAVTHVMEERRDNQPMARVLYRGQYDQPREKVEPRAPSALPPMPASYPRNRLGLAQWLVNPTNPLTARVTVNRFWQEIFGAGLVKTSEDFGSQGQAPSHPELLDWLAVEFRESGWDIKNFFKLLTTSATYRQSAQTTPDKLRIDPENRLLSRGPRFRMDAEMVRDYALAASGLLVPTIGGPSVKPYQPEGIWEAVAMTGSNTRFYKQDHGDKLYRRSLYTFWKRSAPPASMEIFGAPTRESCSVRRERTNTPLQALVTMNDIQFVEAARFLAQHALREGGADADRKLDFITMQLLGRAFDPEERKIARQAYDDFVKHFGDRPDEAKKLLAVGERAADPQLAPIESAALTMVANQVMNLDEVLTK